MLPAPHCLAAAGRHAVPGQESARLCATVALSSAMRFPRRSAKSVARSPEPYRQISPYLEHRKRRARAGHTGELLEGGICQLDAALPIENGDPQRAILYQ